MGSAGSPGPPAWAKEYPLPMREWLLSPWWVGLLGGSFSRSPMGGDRQSFSSFLVPRGGQGQRQWLWEPEGVGIPGLTGCGPGCGL